MLKCVCFTFSVIFRFNLSSYPFLSTVPDSDQIDFKCDGLHDGFYASIKYSCQVYKQAICNKIRA